jgi:hypothetical protein
MAIVSLASNNKNQYRKYPLKQGSLFTSDNGYIVPDDLIVAASISSTDGQHRIYIKQIFYRENYISVAIASYLDDKVLGFFSGQITSDNTILSFSEFTKFVDGNLTIGSLDSATSLPNVLNFDKSSAEFEESIIFCYTPPAVRSISDKNSTELRGNISFGILTNLTKVTGNNQTAFSVDNPEDIFNLADKSSYLNNCPTPAIKKINSVTPFPADEGDIANDGNIYIVGVEPIVFYGIPAEGATGSVPGIINIESPTLTLDSLCALRHTLLPPVNISGFTLDSIEFIDKYYTKPAMSAHAADPSDINYPLYRPARYASNFNATTVPEFYYWPQFVKEEYYYNWKTLDGASGATG